MFLRFYFRCIMDDEPEYVLLNKPEIFVYNIPPRSPQGHRAEEWKDCIWRGRLQIATKGDECAIKLVDVQTGKLFARCPITEKYEQAVERTVDSSRYFVLKIDDGKGRHAFLGMGFENRTDAFDFNCSLSDYSRRREVCIGSTELDTPPKDYSLKEGQKIKVELKGIKKKIRNPTEKDTVTSSGIAPLLAPPPSAKSSISNMDNASKGSMNELSAKGSD